MQKGPAAPDRVRLGAVEIVWNPYIFPLCVVISFTRGCYVCHMLASPGHMSASLTNLYRCPLVGANISKLFLPTQVAYNDKFYVSMPESNSRKSNALARVLLFSPKKVTNLNQIYIYE